MVFFIREPQLGQVLKALRLTAPHTEQIYWSAENRWVRRIQRAGFTNLPFMGEPQPGQMFRGLRLTKPQPEQA